MLNQQTKKKSGKKRRRSRRRRKPNPDYIPTPTGPTEPGGGVLDIANDGSGTLRSEENNFLPGDGDIYVPPGLIKMHALQAGSMVEGPVGEPKKPGQKPLLCEVEKVDGLSPDERRALDPFGKLIVVDPEPQLVLEPGQGDDGDVSLRVIDLLAPIGKGQRGLIVAPPRSGKTVLLQKISKAINEHYPDCHLIVLLIDERPEEATGWRRTVENGEVIVSTLDEGPKNHVQAAEITLQRAHRLVEVGTDVVIVLDSITRLARAYNSENRGGGGILSGGLGAKVLEKPKKFFGSARKVEHGGSLTILGTALVETGSRMDQVIFEEFKGTGNMELVLSRQLAERRIYPAIDIELSGTRKEELLLPNAVIDRVYTLRRVLAKMHSLDAMPLLIDRLMKTESNLDFLNSFKVKE
ncbi:MAG: transcription termination factor Rho [Planctomycetota bacterium]|nr:MAG: transcription termination factor Rho [Planctomycetota bacterium]